MFGSITRLDASSPLRRIALRQMATDTKVASWFGYIRGVAAEYGINLVDALIMPWTKQAWKKYIDAAIQEKWVTILMEGVMRKTTLQWLDLECCRLGTPHPVWETCRRELHQVHKAAVHAKLLTGTYILQATAAKINKFDPI